MSNPHRAPLQSADPAADRAAAALNAPVHRAWQQIDKIVANQAHKWTAIAECEAIDQLVAGIRKALGDFLVECNVQRMKLRRPPSEIARISAADAEHAATAIGALRALRDRFDHNQLPLLWTFCEGVAQELESVAAVARERANRFNQSGRPIEAPEFDKLARGLVQAALAANIKPKQRLELMKSVLEAARKLPGEVIGASLQKQWRDAALNKYLSRIAEKLADKRPSNNRT